MQRKWLLVAISFLLIVGLVVPLAAVAEEIEEDGDNDEEVGAMRHPVGLWLAEWLKELGWLEEGEENNSVDPYDQVMGWHDEGFGFGEIIHAITAKIFLEQIQTDNDSVLTVQDLLDKREDQGWGEIWQ
ncbi:MAG: hypothetical protein U9R48_11615, partial [Chloroflexota bacterium]|nr:hypothetical protein [Chloroflexota bacterium]